MSNYAELICRTNLSFLTGASHPEELITQAHALGLSALALTDRNGVYAIPKAFKVAREKNFKLIVGAEVTLQNHSPIILLSAHRKAYGVLCRILSASHEGKDKGEASLSLSQLESQLRNHGRDGLIALCESHQHTDLGFLKEQFPHSTYISLSRFLDGLDKKRTREALAGAKRFDLPIVATNQVHCHVKERRMLQDVLTCTREGLTLTSAGFKLFSNSERYLKSPKDMVRLFSDLPKSIHRTIEISERCTFRPDELRYRYPSEWIPKGFTPQSYLEHLVWERAPLRYTEGIPENVKKQLRHELNLIEKLHFADYFLTIFEIVEFAREKNILCQGRGSAANSAVCYCLGITAIDPVRMNLLFERFISEERGEPPDIDVDFEHERREEVIQHIYEKYGRDRAAMVSAVTTYRSRSALREVAKAFGIEVGTLSAKKVEREFDQLSQHTLIPNVRNQIDRTVKELKTFPRHLSIHSGGFTLSADPILEIVPVEPARMPGRTIIQWDKYDLDILGLLKVDILALGMLTAIHKSLHCIGKKLHEIPADCPETWKMIQRADTVGTFQIESRAQMNMLGRLQPKNFYDLVIEIAIMRPGPIVGKMVHPYLKRRRGIEKVEYHDPRVKNILGRTLGIPIFQEQVMKLAIELAHFTPGEADQLRRAINGWRSNGNIPEMATRLMSGLLKSGLPKHFAEQIFQQIQGFSMYGFPESHAASFALIAWASAWLKHHHPGAFLMSLMNSQPLGFYSNHSLIDDAKRHGIKILPVDPNVSVWDTTLEDGAVRLGFRIVEGLSRKDAEHVFESRREKPFQDFPDFLARTHLRSDVLQRLAMGGSFASFGMSERNALWNILGYRILNHSHNPSQLKLFEGVDPSSSPPPLPELTDYEVIRAQYDAFNLSTKGHPMEPYRKALKLPKTTTREARAARHRDMITTAGLLLVRQRPPTANGTTFSVLEDEHGFLDIVIFKDCYARYREIILNECFLVVTGELQRDHYSISLVVHHVRSFWKRAAEETPLTIEPRQYF